MKKLKLAVATSSLTDVWPEVNAWALDVPGLAAWNNPGKIYDKVVKVTWQLMHIPSGTCIERVYKREQVVAIADLIAPICDWTQESIDSLSYARTVYALREWWTAYNNSLREAA